ncbi:MAG: gluconate 2-dehydrogenase subunit 3 family protein [Azospirillaceae bacterium]|nr:gluconate 2-dehydrogenase subunit 3 family protein [Azospirillaceae bacterium]
MSKTPAKPGDALSSRRSLLKGFSLLPIAASSLATAAVAAAPQDAPAGGYKPSFFNADEWAFVVAACDRLIPHDEVGPGAVELGVPEFLDRHMQTSYAAGGIWYMQGPFLEAPAEFGYQGRLVLRDIIRVGIRAVDDYARATFGGKTFAGLEHADQETVLKGLEKGDIKLDAIPAKTFFTYFLGEVRNGYFSDPKHGGNRGMGSWKMIGYPGMRADYSDWVEVRDKPYPLPPVDLSGRRG